VRIFGAIFLPQSENGDIFGDGVNIAARIERLASVGAGDTCFERLRAALRR
jgi:class 3 adenylate cyclase